MCVAAMPVEAVTAGSTPRSRNHATYLLIVCVLPLPGSPVRNTFNPVFSIASASSCVIARVYHRYILSGAGMPRRERPFLKVALGLTRRLLKQGYLRG